MPPAPQRGQRIAAAVVALVVFGAAAVFAAGAFRRSEPTTPAAPDPATTVIVHLVSSDGPSADLEYDGQTAHPQIGSNCWSEGGTSRCADVVLFPFLERDFVSVPPGTPISIDGDDQLNRAVVRLGRGGDPNGPFQGSDLAPTAAMPSQAGTYVLIVSASWPQGDVEFYFPIRVVDASEGSPSASPAMLGASMTAPSDGSTPSLTLTVRGTSMAFDPQDGRWPGASISPKPIETFYAVVEPGATLVIDTEAVVEGSLWISDADQNLTGVSIPLD